MEQHIFGARTSDELFIDENLSNIESDPEVCAAIRRTGVDYVLDFGIRDVHGDAAASESHSGVQNLDPSDALVLVDSEGADARLFRIEGCT